MGEVVDLGEADDLCAAGLGFASGGSGDRISYSLRQKDISEAANHCGVLLPEVELQYVLNY